MHLHCKYSRILLLVHFCSHYRVTWLLEQFWSISAHFGASRIKHEVICHWTLLRYNGMRPSDRTEEEHQVLIFTQVAL